MCVCFCVCNLCHSVHIMVRGQLAWQNQVFFPPLEVPAFELRSWDLWGNFLSLLSHLRGPTPGILITHNDILVESLSFIFLGYIISVLEITLYFYSLNLSRFFFFDFCCILYLVVGFWIMQLFRTFLYFCLQFYFPENKPHFIF